MGVTEVKVALNFLAILCLLFTYQTRGGILCPYLPAFLKCGPYSVQTTFWLHSKRRKNWSHIGESSPEFSGHPLSFVYLSNKGEHSLSLSSSCTQKRLLFCPYLPAFLECGPYSVQTTFWLLSRRRKNWSHIGESGPVFS